MILIPKGTNPIQCSIGAVRGGGGVVLTLCTRRGTVSEVRLSAEEAKDLAAFLTGSMAYLNVGGSLRSEAENACRPRGMKRCRA